MIKMLLLDIDGVITNGKVYVDQNGTETKRIDFVDIDAIFEAKRKGLIVGFISGEETPIVDYFEKRFQPNYFFKGCKEKKNAIEIIAAKAGLELAEIAYIGDTRHDYEAIRMVGLGMSPANASAEVKAVSDKVLVASGGNGAVKEAISYIETYNLNLEAGSVKPRPVGDLDEVDEILKQHDQMIKVMLQDNHLKNELLRASAIIADAFRSGNQVLLCGNGGSAADAQHLATEFVSRFYHDRRPLKAEALTTNTSSLTAIGNDYNFDKVFARQLEARCSANDVLIGLTTSGNSSNIIEAFKIAESMGLRTIAMTGMHEFTAIESLSEITIKVPSRLTPRIQEGHILAGHLICELVEKEFI